MRRGFTLVELAIVLVVVGLMAAFAMQAFTGKSGSDCYASTDAQLKTIETALQNFIATHARLPKPANADLGSSASAYGYEATGSITDPLDPGYATDVPAGMTDTGGVLIGALPHMTLGLENSYSSDCWGDKFTYAVTNALTSGNASVGYPGSTTGAIVLKSDAATMLSSVMSYVVVSHGQDQYGATAISATDTTAKNCNGSTEPKLDVENCDSDATFMNATRNTGNTANYFDDLVIFNAKLQSTEPCAGQSVSWLTDCSGPAPALLHNNSSVVNNEAPSFTGTVTATCKDGTLELTAPVCTPGAPATCDSDPGDGLTPSQKYCSGVMIAQGGGDFVCMGGLWSASYPFTCDSSLCESGSASSIITQETGGCSPPPDCSGGDTLPVADCSESAQCICD